MTVHYSISGEDHCIAYRVGARFHPDNCLEALRAISSDGAYQPSYNFLCDFRATSIFDADYQRLTHLATRLIPIYANIPSSVTFVILTDRDIQYGMARMFQQILENSVAFEFHLSRDLADAAQALGLSTAKLQSRLDAAGRPPEHDRADHSFE